MAHMCLDVWQYISYYCVEKDNMYEKNRKNILHAKQMKEKLFFYFNLCYIHAGLLKMFFLARVCVSTLK